MRGKEEFFWRGLGVEGKMGRKKDGPEGEDI
jgi:hypothetical protein